MLTLQIQSGKCCALGGFLIELWSILVVVYTAVCCTCIGSVADHNSIRNPPSAALNLQGQRNQQYEVDIGPAGSRAMG